MQTIDHDASPAYSEALWSKVLPGSGAACAMAVRPSVLTQAPLVMEGGYSPMTGNIVPNLHGLEKLRWASALPSQLILYDLTA